MLQHGILERLNAGEVIVGDGGMCHALEKRGYVKAGPWTPECTVEHPEAGEKMVQSPCSKTISSKFIDCLSLVKCGSLACKERNGILIELRLS